jgi:hypothetical protein
MKAVVRILLGETDSDNSYYTDAEVAAMINDSLPQVASEVNVPSLLTYREYSCVADQEEYSLESDYMTIKAVLLEEATNNWRMLELLDFKTYWQYAGGNTTNSGTPYYYRLEAGETGIDSTVNPGDIWLYPLPDSTYKFRIYFYQYPQDLSSDTDVTELPLAAHWAVCYHAAAMLMRKSSQSGDFRDMMSLYSMEISKINRLQRTIQRDKPVIPRDVMGYGR